MIHSDDFKYDEVRVFTEGNIQYCTPVQAFQSELNLVVNRRSLYEQEALIKEKFESQKFPVFCSFELPNGVYSAYLFKVCTVQEPLFDFKISHFEYKGKNPSLSAMNLPVENCPFDEILPVPKDHMNVFTDVEQGYNTQFLHLESLINNEISEVGMRRKDSGILRNMNFSFPKYLYN